MPDTVKYEVREDATAHITLDRPDKMNALSGTLITELRDGIERAEDDDDVRVVVLTGAGDAAFSAGYDIEPGDNADDPVPTVDSLLDKFEDSTVHVHAIWECNKPVIAAVNGYCLAGGSDIAMACDLVIASEDAQFGYPGLRMAGVPPTLVYPFVMNLHEAKELLFSGKVVDAERAKDLGMVNRVVPDDELFDAVANEVEEIRKMPGNNVRILKHVVNGVAEMQGAKPMFKYSELLDTLGHHTEYGKEYYRIAESEGIEAALEYMNERNKGMENPDSD
ncbi:enoyl-CoA hydratase/isomerase family protein [Halomarina halobia]|uniref:Enoyl-CoA hydratase/isomerase family protein n=1 Tax=Halomarina halobia TaxID=3033386 RepID=A0ABD6AG19_9EURY|nr:enoyl-CoA hydratase-related protein [Halomarina sp. PSR21]